MANPNSIVTVNITIADASVSRTNFGTPLIMTHEAAFGPELTRSYSSTTAMVTDGFAADGPTVAAATRIQSQQPRVTTWKVGIRKTTPVAQTRVLTVAQVFDDTNYTVAINGTAFTVDSGSSATAISIAGLLVAAIGGGSEPVTPTDNADGTFDLVADVAGDPFQLTHTRNYITQDDQTADAGIATDYAAIKAEDDDWYGALLTTDYTLETVALAAAVEADRKQYFAESSDDDILSDTAGNLAETLNTAGYNRTYLMFKGGNYDFGDAGWMGKIYPNDPGSITWAYNTLAGVPVDTLSDTQIANIEANKANHYTTTKGLSLTIEGWASSGRYGDITRGIDWLTVNIQDRIITALANANKIGYNQAGIDTIESLVRAALNEGIGNQLIEPGFRVTVPAIADVSVSDKAARLLGDVDFSATLTGAIHKVTVNGRVSA
jgi:hypothetical protein